MLFNLDYEHQISDLWVLDDTESAPFCQFLVGLIQDLLPTSVVNNGDGLGAISIGW